MSLPTKPKFNAVFPLVTSDGRPTQNMRDYLTQLDALVTAIATGMNAVLVNAANDAAAAAAGVQVGQLYRNGSVIQVRVA